MKNFKAKIGIDFDDVIVDCHSMKSVLVKSMFGVDVPINIFSKESLLKNNLLTTEQYLQMGRKLFTEDHPLVPIKLSLETIQKLISEGFELEIVSSRSEEGGTLSPAVKWMKKHNLNIPITGVGYKNSKKEALKNFDLFIDDDPDNLVPLADSVPHLLLFSSLQNINIDVLKGVTRVSGWEDVYNYVNSNFQ